MTGSTKRWRRATVWSIVWVIRDRESARTTCRSPRKVAAMIVPPRKTSRTDMLPKRLQRIETGLAIFSSRHVGETRPAVAALS